METGGKYELKVSVCLMEKDRKNHLFCDLHFSCSLCSLRHQLLVVGGG